MHFYDKRFRVRAAQPVDITRTEILSIVCSTHLVLSFSISPHFTLSPTLDFSFLLYRHITAVLLHVQMVQRCQSWLYGDKGFNTIWLLSVNFDHRFLLAFDIVAYCLRISAQQEYFQSFIIFEWNRNPKCSFACEMLHMLQAVVICCFSFILWRFFHRAVNNRLWNAHKQATAKDNKRSQMKTNDC